MGNSRKWAVEWGVRREDGTCGAASSRSAALESVDTAARIAHLYADDRMQLGSRPVGLVCRDVGGWQDVIPDVVNDIESVEREWTRRRLIEAAAERINGLANTVGDLGSGGYDGGISCLPDYLEACTRLDEAERAVEETLKALGMEPPTVVVRDIEDGFGNVVKTYKEIS